MIAEFLNDGALRLPTKASRAVATLDGMETAQGCAVELSNVDVEAQRSVGVHRNS